MEERRNPDEEQRQTEEVKEENIQEDSKEDEYSFMQETIKNEAGKKKTKKDLLRIAGMGLLFGLIASFSFSAARPWMDRLFEGDPEQVTIPEEEELQEGEAQAEEAPQEPEPLDADSYSQMQKALSAIAAEAGESVTEVVGVKEDEDWTKQNDDSRTSVSGLIVADNGRELLILGKEIEGKGITGIQVIFPDEKTYEGSLKMKDDNLGFAIYAVSRSDIETSTWKQIKTATLGSSNTISTGETVIALGKPFGYAGAVGFGTVVSEKNYAEAADGQYSRISTDIAGSSKANGVMVNLRGEIIALIDQSISEEDSLELLTGYGISDMKTMIELLSNGESVPYAGILGVDVTEEIQAQGIPQGVYVKEVEVDSPAMNAGIQNGDVITGMNGEELSSLTAYHNALMKLKKEDKVKFTGQRQGAEGYVDIEFDVTIGSKE